MQLQQLLFTQGFGTRRVCAGLAQQGLVTIDGVVRDDAASEIDVREGLAFSVRGESWSYREQAYLLMHKPMGYECSQRPGAWPSVYTLLPAPLRQRPRKGAPSGVQAIGRLDQDTTGLLLFSDDGAFIHRMSSPRTHLPKVYEVTLADPVGASDCDRLMAGVDLHDEAKPVYAAACEATGTHTLRLTLTEGKYHQVKRMIAAVGNRVTGLHRSRIGGLALPADLAPGHWRWLDETDLALLRDVRRAEPGSA